MCTVVLLSELSLEVLITDWCNCNKEQWKLKYLSSAGKLFMCNDLCCCIYVFFSDKAMVAGQQRALDLSTMATVNMAPMSPKTSWISQTIPPRRPSGIHLLKVFQNPPLTLHILALQPLLVDLPPQVAFTNRMSLFLLVEKEVNQAYPAWKS